MENLVIDLVKHTVSRNKITMNAPLLALYHMALINEKVIEKIDQNILKFHTDFVHEGHTLSDEAKRFRMLFVTQMMHLRKETKETVLQELQNICLPISSSFGNEQHRMCYQDFKIFSEGINMKVEIDLFCEKFVLAVNQPDENELDDINYHEFGKTSVLLDTEFFCQNSFNIIRKVINECYLRTLEENELKVIEGFIQKIRVPRMKSTKFHAAGDPLQEKLPMFFQSDKLILLIVSDIPFFTLTTITNFISDYIFISSSLMQPFLENNVCESLLLENDLIVMESESSKTMGNDSFLLLYEHLNKKTLGKKAVFIVSRKNSKTFTKIFSNYNRIETFDDCFVLAKTSSEIRTQLLEETIKFQSEERTLKDVIDEDEELITLDLVEKVSKDEKIKIGNFCNYLENREGNFYFPPKISKEKGYNRKDYSEMDLLECNGKPVIIVGSNGMGKTTLLSKLYEIQAKTENDLLWTVLIDLNVYCNVFDSIELYDNEETEIFFNKSENSSFDYGTVLLRSVLSMPIESKLIPEEKLNFEQKLFQHYFNRDKLCIIVDGFGEIPKYYHQKILHFLTKINSETDNKLIVATTPEFQKLLEYHLHGKGYVLMPFTGKESETFVKNYWQTEYLISNNSLHQFYKDLEQKLVLKQNMLTPNCPLLLKIIADFYLKNENFVKANVLLQGIMMKYIVSNIFQILCIPDISITEFIPIAYSALASLKSSESCHIQSFFHLIYYLVKIDIQQFTKTPDEADQFFKFCQTIAIKQLLDGYPSIWVKDLKVRLYRTTNEPVGSKTEVESLLNITHCLPVEDAEKEISDDMSNLCFLNINGKLSFIHSVFAEYFAATFLVSRPLSPNQFGEAINSLLIKTSNAFDYFVFEIMKKEKYRIRRVLPNNTLLNYCIKLNFGNIVNSIITKNCKYFYFFPYDHSTEYKSPLETAAEKQRTNLIEILLQPYQLENNEEHFARQNKLISLKLTDVITDVVVKNFFDKKDYDSVKELLFNSKKIVISPEELQNIQLQSGEPENKETIKRFQKFVFSIGLLYDFRWSISLLKSNICKNVIGNYFDDYSVNSKILNTNIQATPRSMLKKLTDSQYTPLDLINKSDYYSDEEKLQLIKMLMDIGGTDATWSWENQDFDKNCSNISCILQAAIKHGHFKTFKHFLDKESPENYYLLLLTAAKCSQNVFIQYLLENHKEKIVSTKENSFFAFVEALSNKEITRNLALYFPTFKNKFDDHEKTIKAAIKYQSKLFTIKTLIEQDNVIMNTEVARKLMIYAQRKKRDDISYYLSFKCNLNKDVESPTLHEAVKSGDADFAKLFMINKVNVNKQDDQGNTALHFVKDNVNLLRLLLTHGAMYNAYNNEFKIPIDFVPAVTDSHDLLKEVDKAFSLQIRCYNKVNIDSIFNARTFMQQTLLHVVLENGNNDQIEHVIETYINKCKKYCQEIFNAEDLNKKKPIHIAIEKNKFGVFKKLLSNGALYDTKAKELINTKNENEDFKIFSFNLFNAKQSIKIYLKKPCDDISFYLNCQDENGRTAIHNAVERGELNKHLIKTLIKLDLNFNIVDNNNQTPLDIAVNQNDNFQLLSLLNEGIKMTVDLTKEYESRNLCYHYKKFYEYILNNDLIGFQNTIKDTSSEKLLMANICDTNGNTLLHHAIKHKAFEIALFLLMQGVPYNIKNVYGNSAEDLTTDYAIKNILKAIKDLFYAAKSKRTRFLKESASFLINDILNDKVLQCEDIKSILTKARHQDSDSKIYNVSTLLHKGAKHNKLDVVEWLIDNGANPDARDFKEKTALQIAKEENHEDIITFLETLCAQQHSKLPVHNDKYVNEEKNKGAERMMMKYDVKSDSDKMTTKINLRRFEGSKVIKDLYNLSLSGYVYQLKIILLFLWKGFKKNLKFELRTDLQGTEKFDDVVFYYEKNCDTYVRYVQVKYSQNNAPQLTYSEFFNKSNRSTCSFNKYFISYRKIKQRQDSKKIDDLIFCSNVQIPVALLNKKSNSLTFVDVSEKSQDDIFDDLSMNHGWKKYQLQDISTCKELEEMLKASTNLNLLATEFANYLFQDPDAPKLDLKNYWISSYFNVLNKENVFLLQKVYRFAIKDSNPKNAEQRQRNHDIEEFKNLYINEMKIKKGQTLGVKDLANVKFEKQFIESLMLKNGSTDIKQITEILVQNNSKKAAPLFGNLNNILTLKKEYVFSDDFINNTENLSENARYFRSILLEQCEPIIATYLERHRLFVANALTQVIPHTTDTNELIDEKTVKEVAKELVNNMFSNAFYDFNSKNTFLNNVFEITGTNRFKFSKDFVKNTDPNHQPFRKHFFEFFTQRKMRTQILDINQYLSRVTMLVKEIKNSYTDTLKLNKNVLKLGKISKNKFEGLMKSLNGSVFKATEQRNKIKFDDKFFYSNQNCSNNLAEIFTLTFKEKFSEAEFEIMRNLEIEYPNYPPHFDKLEENGNIDDEIKEFCKLFFIVYTPNEAKLMENIFDGTFNLLNNNIVTFGVFSEIFNEKKGDEETVIDSNNAKNLVDKIKQYLLTTKVLHYSAQYCKELEKYSVKYKRFLDELLAFINQGSTKFLHFATDEILLTSVKVARTLKQRNYLDDAIFNSINFLLQMEHATLGNHVSDAFDSTANLLIIVDEEVKQDIQPFVDTICQIVCNNPKKKLVVIGNKKSKIALALKTVLTHSGCQVVVDKTSFYDLTEDSQELLTKNTNVIFQGNDVSLCDLVDTDDFISEIINSQTLQKIVMGEKITIGEPVKALDETENEYYHPRKIRLIEIDCKVFKENALLHKNLFFIEGKNALKYLKTLNIDENEIHYAKNARSKFVQRKNSRFIILKKGDAKLQFDKIRKNCPEYSVHWLKHEGQTLIWFDSYIPSSTMLSPEFYKHVKRNNKYVDESFFYEYVKQNQVVIISDTAGMGKTTLLKSFSAVLADSSLWKIRINLNQYTETLLEVNKNFEKKNFSPALHLNFDDFDPKTKDYGKLVLKSLLNYKAPDLTKLTLENKIFNYMFAKNKMLLMFDGFDEIYTNYGNEVLLLLSSLQKKGKNRIWITSRKNLKEMLERKFNTFAYDLKPFDKTDQETFLKRYWIINYKNSKSTNMPNQNRLSLYISKLMEALIMCGDTIKIPLQTQMIAKIFQENHDDRDIWISCFKYVEKPDSPEKINVELKIKDMFTLYESFLEENILSYYQGEKITGLEMRDEKEIKRNIFTKQYDIHKIFGYLALIDQKMPELLLSQEERIMKDKWRKDFFTGSENIGIIDSFNADNHPLFAHLTYAEYFCALFLIDKINEIPMYPIFQVVNEILKKDVPVFIECFLYRLKEKVNDEAFKAKLKDKSILEFVIQHGFCNCVFMFLKRKDFNDGFSLLNKSGKKIVHCAAEYGQFDILIHLMSFIYNLFPLRNMNFVFVHNLSNYIFNIDENKDGDFNEHVRRLFEDIKMADKMIFKRKATIFKEWKEPRVEVEQLVHEENVTTVFKYLSFQSIVNVFNVLKPLIEKSWTDSFIEDICTKSDITINEKLQIFELIIGYNGENKNLCLTKLIKTVIRSDYPELLKEIMSSHNFVLTDQSLENFFILACKLNLHDIIETLLEKIGVDGSSNSVELICVALKNEANMKIIELIKGKTKASFDKKTKEGENVLSVAIKYNCNLKKVKYLIDNGADPFLLDENNDSAFTLAIKKADDQVIKYFLTKFEQFGSRNMMDTLKNYFDKTNVFYVNETIKGNTRLHNAIAAKDNLLCHFLLRKGVDVSITDSNGNTPLYLAWANELKDVVRHLLFYGATYNEKDQLLNENFVKDRVIQKYTNKERQTLWHIAAKSGNVEDICEEISTSAINNQDINGNTALHLAVKNDNDSFVLKLLKCGARYNIKNNEGIKANSKKTAELFINITKTFHAARLNNFDFLFDHFEYDSLSDIVNVKDEFEKTFLYYAVSQNNMKATNKLLCHGSDMEIIYSKENKNFSQNECALLISRIQKCLDLVYNEEIDELINELDLIEDNKEFNIVIKIGETSKKSVIAFARNNYQLAKYLLQKGVNVDLFLSGTKFDMLNLRIIKANKLLTELAGIVTSKYFDFESVINYYNHYFKNPLCTLLFINDASVADKIIANVRFVYLADGGTLLHMAAAINKEEIVKWLINEKGADPNVKDHKDNDVYEIATKNKSSHVLRILPPKRQS